MLGLNTCWVAMTYKKGAAKLQLNRCEKLCLVIAVGYGLSNGVPHNPDPEKASCMYRELRRTGF